MNPILLVDSDPSFLEKFQQKLEKSGYAVTTATSGKQARERVSNTPIDIIYIEDNLVDIQGFDLLQELQTMDSNRLISLFSEEQDMKATIAAMRGGAFDFLRKPLQFDHLLISIEKALLHVKKRHVMDQHLYMEPVEQDQHEIVGANSQIIEIIKQVGLLSRSRVNVFISGESGTGKELVARALHEAGHGGNPFVAINCSGIVPTLLESELFGHERGSFTGAISRKVGKLEFAGEGTVFLDEIGDMPLELQSKLLRVIQEREFSRVGGLENIPFTARVVAATHRNLADMVEEGTFREDLFYRLAVTQLHIPPLRERRDDIPILVEYLLDRLSRKLHTQVRAVDEEMMKRLVSYNWPGNVRELENLLTRAMALSRDGVLSTMDLSCRIPGGACKKDILTLKQVEKKHLEESLQRLNWNITHTAKAMDVSPTTLRKKINDYGIIKKF
jgi:two-component system response regulator AtoC